MNQILEAFIKARKLKETPFPLDALLTLYTQGNKNSKLYIDNFRGFKLLVEWLAPISQKSEFQTKEVFSPLYTYEIQEIAAMLKIHPSIIQQEFMRIWRDTNEKD